MTKLVAIVGLCFMSVFLSLGNYWFTFGLWPKSWTAFAFFALASAFLSSVLSKVIEADE